MRSLTAPYDAISNAFRSNVDGLISTVTIPYTLAYAASSDKHFQRISIATHIRALKLRPGEHVEDTKTPEWIKKRRDDPETDLKAKADWDLFLCSTEGKNIITRDTMIFLSSFSE